MPHVAVSTLQCAARLFAHGRLSMQHVQYVVLDEADHMLQPHMRPYMQALIDAATKARGMLCALL
jgi:superfamily II DNA/RNA helicase